MKRKEPSPGAAYVSAKEVIEILRIKPQSLYAYVSRGWIHRIPGKTARERLYALADVERIKIRQRARAGHGPAAASAVRWGEPILESSITDVAGGILRYREREVVGDLATRGTPFENVAELLWSGSWVQTPLTWQLQGTDAEPKWRQAFSEASKVEGAKERLAAFLAHLAQAGQKEKDPRPDQTLAFCRSLYLHLTYLISPSSKRVGRDEVPIARVLSRGWGLDGKSETGWINQALVVSADHELNASAFVARVAASNGANLVHCLQAAMATHLGTRQGLVADQLDALISRISSSKKLGKSLVAFQAEHGFMPGFGHPLYPHGDPRARFLLDVARERGARGARFRTLLEVVEWMRENREESPNLDAGLFALELGLGLPPSSASTLFCFSRIAGWMAHVLEQRHQGFHIRPRAKYVPPSR